MKTRSPLPQSHRSRWFSSGNILTLAILITAVLTACTTDDAEGFSEMEMAYPNFPTTLYDGEWTVDHQKIDTARLEVSNVLKVRLPEQYLTRCYLREHYDLFSEPWYYAVDGVSDFSPFRYTHQPTSVSYQVQGYSESTKLYLAQTSTYTAAGKTFYVAGGYQFELNHIHYSVNIISDTAPTIIHRLDTGLWTIAITIRDFHITNLNTGLQIILPQQSPLTIYYNATRRLH